MAFCHCCLVAVLLAELAPSTDNTELIQEPWRLQSSVSSTDGVRHDSPRSMTSNGDGRRRPQVDLKLFPCYCRMDKKLLWISNVTERYDIICE